MIAKPVWVNANTALNYHTESEDNYYQQEGDLGEWQGTIANQLELGKTITKETLEHMLWGKNPYTGEDLVHGKFNEKGDRIRAGLDLTFTPPKSLSVVYEIAKEKGNEKIAQTLLKLHNDAVEATLQRIEERYSRTRLTINGNTKKIDSQGLAIAKFTHDVARPVEIDGKVIVAPNLHTHALIMNITKDKNGNFKAIESEDIFKNYMAQGMTYRSLLAQGLQENGFEILITDSNKGFFELKNIPSEVNEAMSPRSIQIEAVKELRKEFPNMALGELKQMATYKTRNWKGKIDRTQVRTQNVKIMEEIGLDTKALLSSFQLEKNIKKFSLNTNDYLDNAIKAITEEKSVFKKEDIETITRWNINKRNRKSMARKKNRKRKE
jgi:conjugative relaxase-like TrwC/TraI family protein